MSSIKFEFFDEVLFRFPVKNTDDLKKLNTENLYEQFDHVKKEIYFASPDLYQQLNSFQTLKKKDQDKVLFSFYKYYSRMSTRPIPFGLFSGVYVGQYGKGHQITIDQDLTWKVTFDYAVLYAIYSEVSNHPEIKKLLNYCPNNSIYHEEHSIKLYQFAKSENGERNYVFSSFEYTEPLQLVLESCEKGKEYNDLIELLTEIGAEAEEAHEYIQNLIEENVLISDIEITIETKDYLQDLINVLSEIDNEACWQKTDELKSFQDYLQNTASQKSLDIEELEKFKNYLIAKYPELSGLKSFLKIDLIESDKKENTILDESYQKILSEALEVINKLSLTSDQVSSGMAIFQDQFTKKYGDKLVPLMTAFDLEKGLQYGSHLNLTDSPLIDDLALFRRNSFETVPAGRKHLFLRNKLHKCLTKGAYELSFEAEELKEFNTNFSSWPKTLALLFCVTNSRKKQIHFKYAIGTAASSISRFSYDDPEIEKLHQGCTAHETEANSDKILAEIVHFPERRETGNISAGKKHFKYTIPIASKSENCTEDIYLEDILIGYRNGKMCLFSAKHQKEIIPHRTHRVVPARTSNLPLYQFLGDLSGHYNRSYYFSWNDLNRNNHYPFLPRVKYKNIILSPAKWTFAKEDFKEVIAGNFSLEVIKKFCEQKKLPRYVVLSDGDNELFLDLYNEFQLRNLLREFNKVTYISVLEYLFDEEESLLKSKEGKSVNQEIISCVKLKFEQKEERFLEGLNEKSDLQHRFYPGSKWVFYEIFCSEQGGEILLREHLTTIVESLRKNNLIEKWFFMRYNEGGWHIRFRCFAKDEARVPQISQVINKSLAGLEEVLRFSIGTYEREVDRYGAELIELSEELFFYDSELAVNFIRIVKESNNEDFRWLFLLKTIDSFLDAIRFSLEEKIAVMQELKSNFNNEFSASRGQQKTINAKYKNHSKNIKAVLEGSWNDPYYKAFLNFLETKEINSKPSIDIACELGYTNMFIKSHIHMIINRVMVLKPREHEMVIYNFLHQYYKTKSFVG